MMMALTISLILLLALPAGADVIEWRDSDGVRHYTNLKEEIPAEHRDGAAVVIDEAVRHGHAAPDPVAADPPPAPRQAQVVYDQAALAGVYVEGLQRGLEMAEAARSGGSSANVQINGPLAIANAPGPAVVTPFPYEYYGYPLLTTWFHHGHSRHFRRLRDDQFAFEHNDPFRFEPATFPGPRLSPFQGPSFPFGLPSRRVR